MAIKLNGTNTEASPAFTGDDTDTGLQCGTNELSLVTGGTTAVTVDSSQRVGINTTDPSSNSGSGAQNLVIGTAASSVAGMTINTGTGSYLGRINFGRGTTVQDYGYLLCDHSNGFMSLGVASTERLRILSDGTLRLLNSPGIDFSQIQSNASGMDSEILDSYEEGNFTPVDASDASLTLTTAEGVYTKIGRLVHVQIRVAWPSTANSSLAKIGGFPFNASLSGASISNGSNCSGVGYFNGTGTIPQVHMQNESDHTLFYRLNAAQTNADFSQRELRFGIIYSTAT